MPEPLLVSGWPLMIPPETANSAPASTWIAIAELTPLIPVLHVEVPPETVSRKLLSVRIWPPPLTVASVSDIVLRYCSLLKVKVPPLTVTDGVALK